MRTIEISDEVWAEIARRGKFGEREEDVLRREFGLPPIDIPAKPHPMGSVAVGSDQIRRPSGARRRRLATVRMSSFVNDRTLVVEFHGGPRKSFHLPDRSDKEALRRVRDLAVTFATQAGASYGQEMAVKKALTEAGYHLVK